LLIQFQKSTVSDRKWPEPDLFGSSKGSEDGSLLFVLLGSTLLSLELVLLSLDMGLRSEHSGSLASGLLLVDVLHQDSLVLEDVTLGLEVKLVVDVLVELLLLSVLGQKSSEDSLASHPHELDRHTRVSGTESLTGSGVSALSSGFGVGSCAGSRVDNGGLLDDQTILDKSSHLMPRVGVGDVLVFVGVQPDLVFAALHDSGGEPLLKKESRHGCLLDNRNRFYLNITINIFPK